NVFDFFNAASASAGIKIDAGCNSWTINNNNFYQTTAKAYTVAVVHRALWVTPNVASLASASGFTINNNFIGGSNAAHGGTYTMTGAVGYQFFGMDISVGLGAATSIQNNTISNISMTAAFASTITMEGINLANGNVNVGNITGNT